MAKAEITNQEFAAEYTKGIDFGPGAEPSPDVVDDKAAAWKEYTGGDDVALGGNEFDSATNSYKNRTPRDARDGKGRFQAVRESLERSQKRSDYVRSVLEGVVEPHESQDSETWAAARNAQIARGTNKITPPEFPDENAGDGAEGGENAIREEPLTPEQIKHNEAHQELHTRLVVRLESPEVQQLQRALHFATEKGATPFFLDSLGHIVSDHDNGEEILFHLGANQEKLAAYSLLSKGQLEGVIRGLSRELSTRKTQTVQAPKPKPPDPVSTRASSSAFDVHDESTDPETWARQRNEQASKRGRR
jgi:hypothetical protein